MFKKDSYLLGIILAIVSPAVTFGLLYLVLLLLEAVLNKGMLLSEKSLVLISFIPNLLYMRYYFVKSKLEKTARGLLIITFILVMLFFYFFHER